MRSPGGFGSIASSVPRVLEEASETAIAAWGAESSGPAIAVVAATGELGAGWVILIALIIALVLVVALRILEAVLTKLADILPWGMGAGQWRSFVHAVFAPLDSAENWVADHMVAGMRAVFSALYKVLHLAVLFFIGDVSIGGSSAEVAVIKHLQGEYTDLYRKYNQVEWQIKKLNDLLTGGGTAPTSPPPNPPPITQPQPQTTVIYEPVPGAITQQIHRLQSQMVSVVHNIGVLHGDYNTLVHNQGVMERHITQLEGSLVGVRATQYGVESTLTELHQMVAGVQKELGNISPEVDAATRTLFLMKPLEQLLYLGQPGINTLKKLENEPCQCPRYPEMPSDQSEALAVYEFLTNG